MEMAVAVEHLDAVAGIPVASHHHAPAVYLQGRRQRALGVEAAEGAEGMGRRVVLLHRICLSDAQGLLAAAAQQHITRAEHHADAVVVGECRPHEVPLAVLVVFCGRRGDEVCGMSAHHRYFAVYAEGGVCTPWKVQVGQPLCFYLPDHAGVILAADAS